VHAHCASYDFAIASSMLKHFRCQANAGYRGRSHTNFNGDRMASRLLTTRSVLGALDKHYFAALLGAGKHLVAFAVLHRLLVEGSRVLHSTSAAQCTLQGPSCAGPPEADAAPHRWAACRYHVGMAVPVCMTSCQLPKMGYAVPTLSCMRPLIVDHNLRCCALGLSWNLQDFKNTYWRAVDHVYIHH
jgi:hypothetical protein